jgi:thymidylate synthase
MEKGINIWKGNTTREFLDKMNLPYDEGMMGPMYGYQWRFFNKPYSEEKGGIDQFKNLIDTLKKDPNSRRLLMTDFNPAMVDEGVLYPCHSLILQFYVDEDKLSVKMYQRSADLFLGLPFNIASTTLLLYIVAKLVSMKPDMVHITLGDCHIYEQHIDVVKEQLSRTPYNLPQLELPNFTTLDEVEQTDYTMYILKEYNCHPAIKADMIA